MVLVLSVVRCFICRVNLYGPLNQKMTMATFPQQTCRFVFESITGRRTEPKRRQRIQRPRCCFSLDSQNSPRAPRALEFSSKFYPIRQMSMWEAFAYFRLRCSLLPVPCPCQPFPPHSGAPRAKRPPRMVHDFGALALAAAMNARQARGPGPRRMASVVSQPGRVPC